MKVKTKKVHENGYGATYKKKKGSVYEHPEPSALITQGFVEEVENDNDASRDEGLPGNGGASIPAKRVDGEKHDRSSNDSGSGTGKAKSKNARS